MMKHEKMDPKRKKNPKGETHLLRERNGRIRIIRNIMKSMRKTNTLMDKHHLMLNLTFQSNKNR
jgi:hypothetical protein